MERIDVDDVRIQDAMAWATCRAVMSWFDEEGGEVRPIAIQSAPPSQRGGALWETDFSEAARWHQ
jgi:hypothetical protein